MNPETLDILNRRLTQREAAGQLVELHKAVRVGSPMIAVRYERVLQASGALENPETTPEERSLLLSALSPDAEEKSEVIRLRLTPSEKAALLERADRAGKTLSAFVRDELCR